MRGFRSRSESSRNTLLAIEQLEDRSQPAILGFSVAESAFVALDVNTASIHANSHASFTGDFSLPAQANAHAVIEITIHFGTSNSPSPSGPTPGSPGDGPAAPPSAGTPTSGSPSSGTSTSSSPTSGSPTTTTNSVGLLSPFSNAASLFSAREIATQAAAATATAAASSSLLLPPSGNATASITNAVASAVPPDSSTPVAGSPQSGSTFQVNTPTLYYHGESPAADKVRVSATTDRPTLDVVNLPTAPAAIPTTPAIQLVADNSADVAMPMPALPQAEVVEGVLAPVVDAGSLPDAVESVEMRISPWMWSAALVGTIGASWAVRRYWLKAKAKTQLADRSWRTSLLGLDFDRV